MKTTTPAASRPQLSLAPRRALQIVAPWTLASLLVAGCGGGGSNNDAAQQAQASPQSVATATVQVEGCVINSQWVGAPGTAVHVRSADGHMLGTAFTNSRGVYVVTVPARTAIVVDTAVTGAGGLPLDTGSGSFSVGACLFADL